MQRKGNRKFGLRAPPANKHLKKILGNYPEGSQIVKEGLQNADDARASVFRVLLDERRHGSKADDLGRFMGPALVFHNDGVFHDRDWTGLQNMFESDKSEDVSKIGKFGMGSRSYFHLTDVVFVVSKSTLAFIDPDHNLSDDGGEMVNFVEDAIDPELIAPFTGVFGFRSEDDYHGTIFRLPLRMGRWAKKSTFAPYEYTPTQLEAVVSKFRREAADCLLFLQSVRRVEIWRWMDAAEAPEKTFEVEMRIVPYIRPPADPADAMLTSAFDSRLSSVALADTKGCGQGRRLRRTLGTREELLTFLELIARKGTKEASALAAALQAEFDSNGRFPEVDESVLIQSLEFQGQKQTSRCVDSWRVAIRIAGLASLVDLMPATEAIPLVGVALRTEPMLTGEALRGSCYSYLPLGDIDTGLPIHIHGTFHLTDNRRSLWIGSRDTEGQARKWISWNQTLIEEALPALYAQTLASLEDESYSSYPDPRAVTGHFLPLIPPIGALLLDLPVIFKMDGTRARPRDCCFVLPSEREDEVFAIGDKDMVVRLCQDLRQNAVLVPSHLQTLLQEAGMEFSVTIMDLFYRHLLPHWNSKHPSVLPFVEGLSDLMLRLCQTLGTGQTARIQKFRKFGADLHFIPVQFPGVDYGMDDKIPLKAPVQCYDPLVQGFRGNTTIQPSGDFRAPEVLRVLRQWGLRQTMSWGDFAQDAVCRVCVAEVGCPREMAQIGG